ncbi:MAG: hypothetical protein NC400_00375 [Clostridium sp.]|nr:hypothetical protein [Clostridium sp.]
MDSNEHNKVIAFDTLFCTNHIQMLKVMLPYMEHKMQKFMAVYIKLLELNYTIDYFKKHPYPLCGCLEREAAPDIFQMCSELIPYCTENEKKQLEQIKNIRQGMEMYKEVSQAMEVMKDFMPDMASFMGTASADGVFSAAEGENSFYNRNNSDNDNISSHGGTSNVNSTSGSGSFDMMNMLMNMLSPEQKQMYEMFGGKSEG